jgi:hypothetical protein
MCNRLLCLEGNCTPKKGFKTITVKTEVYDFYFKEWLKVKEEYTIKRGIRSFSGYITYQLAQHISENNNTKTRQTKSTPLNKP